jgi:hypothetical protein
MSKTISRQLGKKPAFAKKEASTQFKKTAVASSLGVCLAMMSAPVIAAPGSIASGISLTVKSNLIEQSQNGLTSNLINTDSFVSFSLGLLELEALDSVGNSGGPASASVQQNFVTYDTSNINGPRLLLKADASGTSTIGSSISTDAVIWDNKITNYGSIVSTSNSTITGGIGLHADASSNVSITSTLAGGGDHTVTGFNSVADADIWGNEINNYGSITATNAGIRLFADAEATRTLTLDINSSGKATLRGGNATADAVIWGNEINNFGSIVSSGDTGIELFAKATATSTLSATTVSGATATITVVGGISSADAIIWGNEITNTGSIVGKDGIKIKTEATRGYGVNLNASSVSGYQSRIDGQEIIADNTVSNISGGRIIAINSGISLTTLGNELVDGNTINNSGLIITDKNMTISGGSFTRSDKADFDDGEGGITGPGIAIQIGGGETVPGGQIIPELSLTVNGTSRNYLSAGFNSLNLSAPGYIAGQVLLAGTANVRLSLTSGPSHSVLWSITDNSAYGQVRQNFTTNATEAMLYGVVPWFVNEGDNAGYDIYATLDPSAFAAAPNMLGDLSTMVSNLSKTGRELTETRRGFWANAQGGERDYEGDSVATLNQKTRLSGATIGYTHQFSDSWRASGFIGASESKLNVASVYSDVYSNSYSNKANGGFVGISFTGSLGPIQMNLGLAGGKQSHKDRRFVNDNLQWWGISHADSKYDSTWYSPEIGFALPIKADAGWSVTPSLSWRYTGQNIDGFTETGLSSSTANAVIASRRLGVSEANAGINITLPYGNGSSISGNLGYMHRTSSGDDNVRVLMINHTKDVPFFYKDISAGSVGIDWKQNLFSNAYFYLNANYIKGNNVDGGDVATGLKVEF